MSSSSPGTSASSGSDVSSFTNSLSVCSPTRNHPRLSHASAVAVRAFPTATCACVREGRRAPAPVENAAVDRRPIVPAVPSGDRFPTCRRLALVGHVTSPASRAVSSADTGRQHGFIGSQFKSRMFNFSFVHGSGKLLFARLFWCRFRQVSVFAHPACGLHVGNHKGHGRHLSRFVQEFLLLASAARRFARHRCSCLLASGYIEGH